MAINSVTNYRGQSGHELNVQQQNEVHSNWKQKEKVDITSGKDDAVKLEISLEGRNAIKLKNKDEFAGDIVDHDASANDLPAYSGIYEDDRTIATALESSTKEEKGYIYDIIRQNFLVSNSSDMTEEERQANISLGMKKAEYAAQNFIPEAQKEQFMNSMSNIAKLASAGNKDEQGNMNYGVNKPSYLGHGSGLVYTTNATDMMRKTDAKAYAEYQKIQDDSSAEDKPLKMLKYLTNWYVNTVSNNQNAVSEYEKNSGDNKKGIESKTKIDDTFNRLDTGSKTAFLQSLLQFQKENQNLFTRLIQTELSNKFYL